MLEMFVRVRGLRASERASVREIGTAESGAEYPVLAILLSPLPLTHSHRHLIPSSSSSSFLSYLSVQERVHQTPAGDRDKSR